MRLEVHILQNFAPSNLNRDDTGSPKDAEFGGHRRARISSQCIKRAVRRYFDDNKKTLGFTSADLAIRTKRLLEEARRRLIRDGRDADRIDRAVTAALAAGKIAMKADDPELTQYLLFLGEGEVAKFVAVVDQHFEVLAGEPDKGGDDKKKATAKQKKAAAKEAAPKEVQDAVPELLDGGKSADLALFGRMLADLPNKKVVAACQVAHAISTNKIHSMEMDYYTAVDDINNDSPGADMIGTVEFNSACFYRYANLDLGQLAANLQGDADLARRTAEAFLTATVHAIPTGKQNTFAAHNPPSLVFAVVRSGPPVSLANAFVKPVWPTLKDDLVTLSVKELDGYYGRLTRMYGDGGRTAAAVCCLDDVELTALKPFKKDSVAEVIATAVDAAFGKGAA